MRTVLKDGKMNEKLGTSRSCFQYSPLVHLICTLARSCESCHIARPRAATNSPPTVYHDDQTKPRPRRKSGAQNGSSEVSPLLKALKFASLASGLRALPR